LWGTRGSLPSPGPDTVRYGGNTACVEVRGEDQSLLVLDAGTGIRRLGATLEPRITRVDILLTHLHMDHLQGLGFFGPLERADLEIHIWGPSSVTHHLEARLSRYLSPPLFPVRLHDLPSHIVFHDVPLGRFAIAEFEITAALVCHPGMTVGYRIAEGGGVLAYLPDHEPALGVRRFPERPEWTSGYDLASHADLLIHDAQYSATEYREHVGWGHSAVPHAVAFAALAKVGRLIAFHHDPNRSDAALDRLIVDGLGSSPPPFRVTAGKEGMHFHLGRPRRRGKRAERVNRAGPSAS
jgi:phosphoribosyl 1,2-cyclic phosphodiesterase